MGRNDRNGMAYNRTVIERCAGVLDYISIHHYEDPGQFARGPQNYEAFFREIGELIAKSANPNLKIDVSEWNAQSTDWRTGLYCGGLLNAFERCGDILEIGGPALFLRHVSATAWDNAFINFDQSSWFPAPNYVVMKLWRDNYAPERIAVSGEAGPLNVSATRRPSDDAVIVKVVNPAREQVSLELSLPANVSVGQGPDGRPRQSRRQEHARRAESREGAGSGRPDRRRQGPGRSAGLVGCSGHPHDGEIEGAYPPTRRPIPGGSVKRSLRWLQCADHASWNRHAEDIATRRSAIDAF